MQSKHRRNKCKYDSSTTHIYMTDHVPGLVQALKEWRDETLVLCGKTDDIKENNALDTIKIR